MVKSTEETAHSVKVVQIEKHWIVAMKGAYDDEDERTIIGEASTKEGALLDALQNSLKIHGLYNGVLDDIAKLTNNDICDLETLHKYIEIDGVEWSVNGDVEKRFGSIARGEDGTWGPYLR